MVISIQQYKADNQSLKHYLAFELMNKYNLKWEIEYSFTPPAIKYKNDKILDKIFVEIPPNSALIFKVI